jgi:G6PDH family F420-dependent oxidoreductase
VYTLPEQSIEVYVAAAKTKAAKLAARIGDGLISTSPEREVVESFEGEGGAGKEKLGMMHVAYDSDAKAGLKRATETWPNLAFKGPLGQDLATPDDFEAAAEMVDEEDVAESTPCGPDPEPYLELIRKYDEAGFTHVYIHQIGDNQDEFAEFAKRELMPRL